jgi:FkbM family methyltransferase
LNQKYRDDARVVVVSKAVGRVAGTAQMMVSQAHTISSMSPSWVNAVRSSGRFVDYEWGRTQEVNVMTLDALIETFGRPAFCKIDVEGYECDVLAGLSSAIPVLSFEFTPELAEVGTACIDRLAGLGDYEFNFDVGESMHLRLANWVGPTQIKQQLKAFETDQFGDIYARVVGRAILSHPE